MRCPSCGADNPKGMKTCSGCGKRLERPNRRRDAASLPGVFWTDPSLGARAYRLSVYALIPLAGLLLGPLALVLGVISWLRPRPVSAEPSPNAAPTAILLGAIASVANWAGLTLIIIGLKS